MSSNSEVVEALRWKKTPVLDSGFVCLVDVMGDDAAVVQAARVSYANDKREGDTTLNDSDETLIKYLLRHSHTTPFEMAELKFLVRVPMDCWRQWIRHRTASVNEYSTRYTKAIDDRQETAEDEWRLQSTSNKQGSAGFLTEWPAGWKCELSDPEVWAGDRTQSEWRVFAPDHAGDKPPVVTIRYADLPNPPTPGDVLSVLEKDNHGNAQRLYELRLAMGVAKEQARKDLPLSTYTEAYWKIDLHNLMHFLRLRLDSHAQLEIRLYANAIADIVKQLYPTVWVAYEAYVLNSMRLTEYDINVMRNVIASGLPLPALAPANDSTLWPEGWRTTRHRERDECIAKLQKLMIFAQ